MFSLSAYTVHLQFRANIEVINSFLSKMIQYMLPSVC
nr:MAG TPA: hypothetical protein [Caudoviricetes sp.]